MNIEELFPDGKWSTREEYVVRCPWLDSDTHDHCHISVAKEVFFCHYCGECGPLQRLLDEYKVVGELEPREEIAEKEVEPIDFSQFPRIMGEDGALDILALKYLRGRGVDRKEIDKYGIRYSDSGRFYGRVLLPVTEFGHTVCFSARSFIDRIWPSYLFPRKGETLLTLGDAIFGYDEVIGRRGGFYILVEGIFDAIRVNREGVSGATALAILNKHLSQGQIHKLLKLEDATFFIMLDADAHKDGVKVAKILADFGRDVRVCFLQEGDPDLLSDDALRLAIDRSEEYSFKMEMEILLGE